MNKLIRLLLKLLPAQTVFAHCDIPCGIYDPHQMQLAAHTIIRMVNMINDLKPSSEEPPFDERKRIISQISRLTEVKEEHAKYVEHELVTLWADYFNQEHLKDYPQLHDLIWNTIKLASTARQNVDLATAAKLLSNTQEVAEIFWKTKGLQTLRIPSGYPTQGEIVTHR